MPDFESLFPGRFLKKTDLLKPTTVRIVEVTSSEGVLVVEDDDADDKKKAKGIMRISYAAGSLGRYAGSEMILCKTNATLIAVALGERDFTKWGRTESHRGHLITLHNCPTVKFGREKTGGIRVFGSPEMTKAITVEIKMPRKKKPEVYELVPTGQAAGGQQQPATTAPAGDTARGSVGATQIPDQPPPDDAREPGWEG